MLVALVLALLSVFAALARVALGVASGPGIRVGMPTGASLAAGEPTTTVVAPQAITLHGAGAARALGLSVNRTLSATTGLSGRACDGARSPEARRETANASAVGRHGADWRDSLGEKGKSPGEEVEKERRRNGKEPRCATSGLGVTPAGAPGFALTNLVPGDTASITGITLQVTGSASPLTGIYAQNRAGALTRALNLRILDTTTGLTVYAGPVSGLSTSPAAPQRICATGSTDTGAGCIQTWLIGEAHAFTFTVSYPSRGKHDNAYQGTSGSLDLVWGRS